MSNNADTAFNQAALAVTQGDEALLHNLLQTFPELIHQRSQSLHKATLLHYISANGVEDDMQRCPPNAVNIARILLEAGAEVDATAECYGGGPSQTPLSLLVSSYHPFKANVQVPIAQLLIQYGAKINGLENNGGPLATAIAFGYLPVARVLADMGSAVNCIQVTAGLGDSAKFETFFDANGELTPEAGISSSDIITSVGPPKQALSSAFWYACLHDQLDIAKRLLHKGANINHQDKERFTALHHAAVRGSEVTVSFLLSNNADAEITNDYGGTVLDTLCWFATKVQSDEVDYVSMAKLLLDNNASALAVSPYPIGHKQLDNLIQPYRKTNLAE